MLVRGMLSVEKSIPLGVEVSCPLQTQRLSVRLENPLATERNVNEVISDFGSKLQGQVKNYLSRSTKEIKAYD